MALIGNAWEKHLAERTAREAAEKAAEEATKAAKDAIRAKRAEKARLKAMADHPTDPFASPAPAPATQQRPIAQRRGGWPVGVKKADIGAYKAAKAAKEKPAPDTYSSHSMETPQRLPSAGVEAAPVPVRIQQPTVPAGNGAIPPSGGSGELPKPYATRHRLRPLEEYPADEAMGEKFHIPRDRWPTGFALQWQAVSVWNQPLDDQRATATLHGWEPVHPGDFDGRYAYKVPAGWGDRPIVIDGLMLQARDARWHALAQARDKREAQAVINIRVRQLHKGELEGISLDTQHKHLSQTNFVNASVDTVGTSGESK